MPNWSLFGQFIILILIQVGGVGFVVWFDLVGVIVNSIKQRFSPAKILSRLPEHTKIYRGMTSCLSPRKKRPDSSHELSYIKLQSDHISVFQTDINHLV